MELENTIRAGELPVLGGSGGVDIFADQAAQDGSSADLPVVGSVKMVRRLPRLPSGTCCSMPWCGLALL